MSHPDQKNITESGEKSIRVLISAYACHPEKVSEPGVAWMQVKTLVLKSRYDITIISRKKNVIPVRDELKRLGGKNFSVVGVDLPVWARLWKRGHLALHIYYYIWQFLAYFVARRLDKNDPFDVAHHISFMTLRTNMVPFLRPPCVVGPVGGAQIPPKGFEKILRHPFKERLRTLSISTMRFSPLFRSFLKKTDIFLLANRNNLWVIPDKFRHKCFVRQIGWDDSMDNICNEQPTVIDSNPELIKIYWGGRLIGWKGLEILLRALSLVRDAGIKFKLDVTGKGPDGQFFQSLARELNLDDDVVFHGWLKNDKVLEMQVSTDVYVFTSLHETTGTALFEMMALGKSLAVVDYAGPGEIVEKGGALKISVKMGLESSISECAKHIVTLARNKNLRIRLGEEAKEQLKETYSWDAYISYIEELYELLSVK